MLLSQPYHRRDGKKPWMGSSLGISGFHLCVCHSLLSVRSFRFVQHKLRRIKLLLQFAITVFEILRGSLPEVVFKKQHQQQQQQQQQ